MFDMSMSMLPMQEMRITPALLNLTQLLTLTSMDLHQAVRQELAENPALEEVEAHESACPRCDGPLVDGICLRCAFNDAQVEMPAAARDEELDPLLFVAAPRSLSETLLSDLTVSLPAHEHAIAVALVGSLDERGFLTEEPAALAVALNIEPQRLEAVLQRLRELGPPGIATRNVQECMLAQIDALAAQGITCPHARSVVADYLDDFGAGRFKQIARQLHIRVAEVEAVRHFVRRYLWPYPAQAAQSVPAAPSRTRYRRADIAIIARDDSFVVEVLQSPRRVLRLNPLYQDLARQSATLEADERAHVQEYIARARLFLNNLRQRETTLQRIGEAIVAHQEAFLNHGVRHLAPLTRSEIAVNLGIHESTVSRATADKTALLPNGTLYPMSEFFVAARGVQDVLRELIANEREPLSDEELTRRLNQQGYAIARRTVAKYRDMMKIPPSHLR